MASKGAIIQALLGQELRQRQQQSRAGTSRPGQNVIWREKVIEWYFAVVSALDRQHQTQLNDATDSIIPFNRTSVHVTTALLDTYLLSLPPEMNACYRRDHTTYQLLATTSLLLGMRLTRHDRRYEEAQQARQVQQVGEMKRVQRHVENMNEAHQEDGASHENAMPSSNDILLPSASTLLRISAAPKSISEQKVMSMVREMTGSRAFPRSKLVTVLDFIRVFCGSTTRVSRVIDNVDGGILVSLGPYDAGEAYRIADASLRDVSFLGCRPSIVACAAITLALLRSSNVDHDAATLRRSVCASIFGDEPLMQEAMGKVELRLFRIQSQVRPATPQQIVMPSSRGRNVEYDVDSASTTHVIPLEDE